MSQKKQELTTKVKTEKHDQIHLWLHDKDNQRKLALDIIPTSGYTVDGENPVIRSLSIYGKGSGVICCGNYQSHMWFDAFMEKNTDPNYKHFTIPEEDRLSFATYSKHELSNKWQEAFDNIPGYTFKNREEFAADLDLSWFKKNIGYDSRRLLEAWIEEFIKILKSKSPIHEGETYLHSFVLSWWQDEKLKYALKAIDLDINKVIVQRTDKTVELQSVEYVIPEIKREVPMYSGYYRNLANVIDCIISVEVKKIGKINLDEYSKNKSWVLDNLDSYVKKYTILCEFKPSLYSISSLLGQIHIYINHLKSIRQYSDTEILPVVITFDQNKQYDALLQSEGIGIYRLTNGFEKNDNT